MTSIPAQPDDQHDHDGHESHDPHLAHHFESLHQQFDSGKLGMWLFLATEVLFFGGLFAFFVITNSFLNELFPGNVVKLRLGIGIIFQKMRKLDLHCFN